MQNVTILDRLAARLKTIKRALVRFKSAGFKVLLKSGSNFLSYTVVLLPGSFFCALGAVTFVYPQHANEMFALALLFSGVVLSVVGYRVIQLRLKLESMIRKFNGKIYLHGVRVESGSTRDAEDDEERDDGDEENTSSVKQNASVQKNSDRANSGVSNLMKANRGAASSAFDNSAGDKTTVLAEFEGPGGSKKVTVH